MYTRFNVFLRYRAFEEKDQREHAENDAADHAEPVHVREKHRLALHASSVNTTARDYALFVDAVLNGKGLSSSVLRQMETPEIALDLALQDLR